MIAVTTYDDYISSPYDYPDERDLIGECDICGKEIYKGDSYYQMDGYIICDQWQCLHKDAERCGFYVTE